MIAVPDPSHPSIAASLESAKLEGAAKRKRDEDEEAVRAAKAAKTVMPPSPDGPAAAAAAAALAASVSPGGSALPFDAAAASTSADAPGPKKADGAAKPKAGGGKAAADKSMAPPKSVPKRGKGTKKNAKAAAMTPDFAAAAAAMLDENLRMPGFSPTPVRRSPEP